MTGFYPLTTHESLTQAVIAGNEAGVRDALQAGANPNRPDTLGDTAVLWAAAMGEVAIIRELLAHGGTLTHVNAQGDTLWHAAARQDQVGVFDAWPVPADQVEKPNREGETVWSLALDHKGPNARVAQWLARHTAQSPWHARPAVAARRLHDALPHPDRVQAVLDAGGAIGWDTAVAGQGTPWAQVLLRCPDHAKIWRPEGAQVLAFRHRRRP